MINRETNEIREKGQRDCVVRVVRVFRGFNSPGQANQRMTASQTQAQGMLNQGASGNAGFASRLAIGHRRPGVPERDRWAFSRARANTPFTIV